MINFTPPQPLPKRTAKESELHSNKKYWQKAGGIIKKRLEEWSAGEVGIRRVARNVNALCGGREKEEWRTLNFEDKQEVQEFLEDLVDTMYVHQRASTPPPKFNEEEQRKLGELIGQMERELSASQNDKNIIPSVLKTLGALKDLIE